MLSAAVEQSECSVDVCGHERSGIENGSIDMAFGGEVQDSIDVAGGQDGVDELAVTNVSMSKVVPIQTFEVGEIGGIPGIGQFVDVDDGQIWVRFEHESNEIRTNKTATSGDHNTFHFRASS